MRVCFLGTAGAESTAKRNNSCFYIEDVKKNIVLVDTHGNIVRRLKQAGVEFSALEYVVFTHHHPDHIIGLPSLLQEMWLHNVYSELPKREKPLYIYAGTETIAFLSKILDFFKLNASHKFLFPVIFKDIEQAGMKETIGGFDFSFIRVSHGDIPCFGFRVHETGKTQGLVYSADTQPIDAVFNACAEDDILVHECSSFKKFTPPMFNHTDISQIEDNIPHIAAKRIFLTHTYFKDENHEKSEKTRLEAEYNDCVIIAEDLQSFEV